MTFFTDIFVTKDQSSLGLGAPYIPKRLFREDIIGAEMGIHAKTEKTQHTIKVGFDLRNIQINSVKKPDEDVPADEEELTQQFGQFGQQMAQMQSLLNKQNTGDLSILQDSGISSKYSVVHESKFVNRVSPLKGYGLKTHEEYSISGQTHFSKIEVSGAYKFPISTKLRSILDLRFYSNLLIPISGEPRICDRFFVTGPYNNVRGFKSSSAPKTGNEYKPGGDFYIQGSADFSTPIPYLQKFNARFHLFTDTGSSIRYNTNLDLNTEMKQFLASVRWSAGVGLSVPFPRIEKGSIYLSYALPVRMNPGDTTNPYAFNFQFEWI